MAKFRAIVIDAETGGEGSYDFSGSGFLISASPMRVWQAFFQSEIARENIQPLFPEFEVYTAFRHEDSWVITVTGALIRESGRKVPYMSMIHLIDAEAA
ncbi:MAG: hypothetical protein AAGH74_15215 [Pseudomonadota bacterium]